MRVEPATARYSVEETDTFLRITIPARIGGRWMPWIGIAWVAAALAMLGAAFEKQADAGAFHFHSGALASFLFVLALVGFCAAGPLIWMYFGREEITIAGHTLLRRLRAGPLQAKRVYPLSEAKRFRISARHATACSFHFQPMIPLGLGRGSIHFDLGGETRYIGSGLDETESAHVLARMAEHVSTRSKGQAGIEPLAAESQASSRQLRGEEVHITLRPWRNAAMLTLTICGLSAVVAALTRNEPDPGMLWFCCGYGLVALAWLLLVREEITVREGLLVRRIGAGVLGRTRVYALAHARNLRLALLPPNYPQTVRWLLGGSVWFDNGERLAKLGVGLSDLEADLLVARLARAIERG